MSPVQSLVAGVVHVVENVQEQHRRADGRKRISRALLTLRAAAQVLEETKRQRRRRDKDDDHGDGGDWSSELGAALFAPLDPPHLHHSKENESDGPTTTTITTTLFPVQILPDSSSSSGDPRLLTQAMFQQLIDEGVPQHLHLNAWERVFSIGRDGDSFRTFLERCAPFRHTILVVQTTTGHLLGGFASETWQEQDGPARRHAYYGTGVSFLFANHPLQQPPPPSNNKPLNIYPWTGTNDFCQICDKDKSTLAMGGSGAFGFILEDNFNKGSTDRCGTFGNPPLTPDVDGIFTVASMEVYGLVPFGLLPNYTGSRESDSPHSVVNAGF